MKLQNNNGHKSVIYETRLCCDETSSTREHSHLLCLSKVCPTEPIPEGGINRPGPKRRLRRKPAELQPSWRADGKIMTLIKEIQNLLQRDRCLRLIVLKALNRERVDKAEINACVRKSDDEETHGCGGVGMGGGQVTRRSSTRLSARRDITGLKRHEASHPNRSRS